MKFPVRHEQEPDRAHKQQKPQQEQKPVDVQHVHCAGKVVDVFDSVQGSNCQGARAMKEEEEIRNL